MSGIKQEEIERGLLTTPIDSNSNDFEEFKIFLESKVNSLTTEQKNTIEIQSIRIKMLDYLRSKKSRRDLLGAGEFLREILSKLKIKQNRFSEYLGIKPSNLSKILNGERNIGFEMSLILEEIFDIESNLWLRIQVKNKLLRISKKEMESYKKYKLGDLTKITS